MKKNLTKLALSGAALAAVAATLGTSTYAWYTTNPTVSANNIVGASSDQGASSIYISKDTTTKNWSSEVTFNASDFSTAKLVPVQPATGKFTKLDGADIAATDVLTFSLWFKSSKTADTWTKTGTGANGIDLYIKSISIKNTTASLKPADNLLYGNTTYSASDYGVTHLQPTYNVDFVQALGMRVVDANYDSSAITRQTFELASYNETEEDAAYGDTAQGVAANNFVTNAHAHAYYNKVMPLVADESGKKPGETGYVETPALSSTAISAGKLLTGSLAATPITTLDPTGNNQTARKMTFYVYLNGWNEYCYDACQGQQFTLNIQFTKVADDALGA